MKRIFCLLLISIISTTVGFCAISNRDLINPTYMKNQGYSKETTRIVGEQVFSPKKDKFAHKNNARKFWNQFNNYFDPAHDDGRFGYHDINPSNSWTDF